MAVLTTEKVATGNRFWLRRKIPLVTSVSPRPWRGSVRSASPTPIRVIAVTSVLL